MNINNYTFSFIHFADEFALHIASDDDAVEIYFSNRNQLIELRDFIDKKIQEWKI